MADTFHSFMRLPMELRLQIWALAAHPRNLHIRRSPSKRWPSLNTTFAYASPNLPPAVMHVCQEARQHAPFRKAFLTSAFAETKYIWVNFQKDMICLPDDQLRPLAPHCADIERLRLTAEVEVEGHCFLDYFKQESTWLLEPFVRLRELHIAVEDKFLEWAESWMGVGYANCPRDNIRFLDLHTGLLLTGPQLVLAYDWCWRNGGKAEDIDDFDEEWIYMIENYNDRDLQ
ncbi:hypothetical protein F4808DRAFT_465733 [Astrocystis sublimbata]|nr:hypothetical protein F4808DRAFT_465733 [Astrocystis sublimbata]